MKHEPLVNKGDREIEREVADLYERKWNVECIPTGTYDVYDFDVYGKNSKRKVCLLEVRKRDMKFGDFENIWMNYEKWRTLLILGITLEVPVFFAVRFNDGIYSVDLTLHPRLKTAYGDRGEKNRRKRPTDNAKVVEIPSKIFRIIEE